MGQSHTDDSPEAVEVRMAALLQDMASLDAGLEPESTLHGILDAIMRVSGACYGAAGLCAPDGTPATFLQAGALAQAVPDSPDRDMLGFLRNRTGPLRIDGLARSAAEVGLPELLPPMRAVLGVPLVSHGEVLGSLYVADSRAGFEFSDAHVGVVEVLATVAADVVHSVWHLAKVRTVARWVSASREITMALLGMSGGEDAPLRLIVGRAAELTVASQAAILVPSEADRAPEEVRSLTVAVAAGARADEVEGQQVPVSGSTSGRVFRTGESTMTDGFRYPITSFTDQGRRPAIVVPLRSATNNLGVIAVARDADDPPFDVDEMAIMEDFAHHAAVALTLCRANEQARQLTVLSDRERIARDLHDHVIQRLFLAGMDLQGTIARHQVRSAQGAVVAHCRRPAVHHRRDQDGDLRPAIARGFRHEFPATDSGGGGGCDRQQPPRDDRTHQRTHRRGRSRSGRRCRSGDRRSHQQRGAPFRSDQRDDIHRGIGSARYRGGRQRSRHTGKHRAVQWVG
nr:GAF domain-containing protein [Mycolicibacterium smegmatis]